MDKHTKNRFFIVFIMIGILVIVASTNFLGLGGFLERSTSGIQAFFYQHVVANGSDSKLSALQNDNLALAKQLVDISNLKKENQALRDQFQSARPFHQDVLPARVIGAPTFIPGKSDVSLLVIDQGKNSGVTAGMAVIYKDNFIGKVTKAKDSISQVSLSTSNVYSLKATDSMHNSTGVLSGIGNGEMVLDHVVTSDVLSVGDLVVTVGDTDINGTSLPANLVVGKIISVDKKASELFQSAKVKSLVDVSKLPMVFVVVR